MMLGIALTTLSGLCTMGMTIADLSDTGHHGGELDLRGIQYICRAAVRRDRRADLVGRLGAEPQEPRRRPATLLDFEDQARGVFDAFLDAHEECDRLAAVDDAVIVGERDIHHRPDLDRVAPRT